MKARITDQQIEARRRFLFVAASTPGLALACASTSSSAAAAHDQMESDEKEAEVTPGEDLMQEHGVLERILLLYGEAARRLDRGEPLELSAVREAAGVIRRFIEEYHEKLEEEFVFPRLEAARQETGLVAILRRQHRRGRELTDEIARLSSAPATPELARALRDFERMYRPHAAREETVLFPAFRRLVGRSEYRELGEQFEEREHELLGEHGFEGTVEVVGKLEAALGIGDLSMYTA